MTDHLSEDDTYEALRRESFASVLDRISVIRIRDSSLQASVVKRIVMREIAESAMHPHSGWETISGGWKFEDFKEECKKRYNEYIR